MADSRNRYVLGLYVAAAVGIGVLLVAHVIAQLIVLRGVAVGRTGPAVVGGIVLMALVGALVAWLLVGRFIRQVLKPAGKAASIAARVAQGDPGDPQDESRAFYADLFTDDWREIDWSQPARTVHNQVRSWLGVRGTARGAFGMLAGERALITKTRLEDASVSLAPGATMPRDDGTLLVGCGDHPLAIVAWEPAGKPEAPPASAE